jgi:serine/threonine-protein kinase HipA
MSQDKVLDVRLDGHLLGRLEQTPVGKMSFRYVEGATRALSLSMPVRAEPYDDEACEAYFGGLLPESEPARVAIGRHYGANPNNNFSLLRAIGHDCAGALSLHAPGEAVLEAAAVPLAGRFPTEAELARHLRELPKRPLMIGVDGIRLSLAGAQDKAALCMIDGQLAFPGPNVPTTHILKPAIAAVGETVVNEYLCMRLAAAVGLPVAPVEMRRAEDVPFLLVERFDRETDCGTISRIHQEDFCQALGVRSTQKYESDGGPNLSTCFALMKRLTYPARARTELLQTLVFNVLIGNGDAHAKNYSILHRPEGGWVLTPAYDLMCTRYYFGPRSKMAMKLGGYYEFERIQLRHWQRFSQATGFTYPLVRKTLEDLEARLQEAIAKERDMNEVGEAHAILDYISRHAQTIKAQARTGPAIS